MNRKKLFATLLLTSVLTVSSLSGCGSTAASQGAGSASTESTGETTKAASKESKDGKTESNAAASNSATSSQGSTDYGKTADSSDMAEVEKVGEDWMTPIGPDGVANGVYQASVDSSSSMFKIADCVLTVSDDSMTARLTMNGTGYLYLYMGTAEEAAKATEADYIPFEEDGSGAHTFTIPVKALDEGFPCAAFSKRKEQWYDRTLLVRSDSLPAEALLSFSKTEIDSLGLEDGEYTAEVTLHGGSGKAKVTSPAKITVADGTVTAEIIWSSNNYDYMKVNGVRYDPVSLEEHSVFEIPVDGFDYNMPVLADTTAMSTPHEIEYTLFFDSKTITKAE